MPPPPPLRTCSVENMFCKKNILWQINLSAETMPRVHRTLIVPQGVQALPHDTGGKLSDLYVEALATVFGAQFLRPADPSNPTYVRAVERAIMCTKNARAGWLAVRTEAMPMGDNEGAGKAAMALAGFALELDRLGVALRWLTAARKELGPAYADEVKRNTTFVLAHIEDAFETELQLMLLQAWRGVCAGAAAAPGPAPGPAAAQV